MDIHRIIYSYDPNEFLPVWREGKLDNKAEFVRYKLQVYLHQVHKAFVEAYNESRLQQYNAVGMKMCPRMKTVKDMPKLQGGRRCFDQILIAAIVTSKALGTLLYKTSCCPTKPLGNQGFFVCLWISLLHYMVTWRILEVYKSINERVQNDRQSNGQNNEELRSGSNLPR